MKSEELEAAFNRALDSVSSPFEMGASDAAACAPFLSRHVVTFAKMIKRCADAAEVFSFAFCLGARLGYEAGRASTSDCDEEDKNRASTIN